MTDCGHRCCGITDNAYHVHSDPPGACAHCATVARATDRRGAERAVTALLGPYRSPAPGAAPPRGARGPVASR